MAYRLKTLALKWLPWMTLLWIASFIFLAWGSYSLVQANIYNANLIHKKLQNNLTPDAIFADASYWAARKDSEKSLKLYALASSSKDAQIRKAAHYNIANIYLRQAYQILNDKGYEEWDKVTPLLSIAKDSYRETLRLAPEWMEAKYNYELLLRLSPIIENSKSRKQEEAEESSQEVPPEGWPAIPGFPRGMP